MEQYLLYFVAIGLVFWAQFKVKGAYTRYSQMETSSRMSGAQVARQILDENGLSDVAVKTSKNAMLSDHYDPKNKIVFLSPKVYSEPSIASVAIAAHEVSHAIQHAENYSAIVLRNAILPFAIISGNLGWTVCFIGLIISFDSLIWIGVGMLGVIALFQLVTLPVELNASSRALNILLADGIVNSEEQSDAKAMLSAAAFTYIAALLATLLQILRIILLSGSRQRR